MCAQFNVRQAPESVVAELQGELGIPHFMANIMASRGITNVEEAEAFLYPNLETDWKNPYLIPGLKEVADRLEEAVRQCKHILVFGDFDLDGMSATTVLSRGLQALGGRVTPFIPMRFEEGYGLTAAAVERVKTYKPDVVVTVDNGIACKNEAYLLEEAGIELLVTDHHEAADLVPVGVPVADPKLDENCPSVVLAGVGVALKLVQVLGGRLGVPYLWRDFLDFAALGTIADLMPLVGENRALVAAGLEQLNNSRRPCIAALAAAAHANDKPFTSTNLGFSLVPRLNAAGRMGNAQLALNLLMADDFDIACDLAAQLEELNDRRRAIEAELSVVACQQAEETYRGGRVLVVAGEGWHEGVKGVVANRLVSKYGVPSMLFTIDGDEARGSGRSVGNVNLFKAVESVSDLTVRFGGHEAAVGVTVRTENLSAFARRLGEYLETLPENEFHPIMPIDAVVSLDELTQENVERLDELAPFGQDNQVPMLLARNVMLSNCRAVGELHNHLSCALNNGDTQISGIMFNCDNIELLMKNESVVNVAFEVSVDEWRGRKSVKAMIRNLTPARPCAGLEACLDPNDVSFVSDLYGMSEEDMLSESLHTPDEMDMVSVRQLVDRATWETLAHQNPQELEDAVVHALIGDADLHESQQKVLDACKDKKSVLAVMATGRGKSLIFQVNAACMALANHQVSLFVYPLRALIADQAYHLAESLEPFGIVTEVLTGESTPEERVRIFEGMRLGHVDIVLTTPEFLDFHVDKFAKCDRIGFMVIDEAHHIGQAKTGQRTSYANMGEIAKRLGNPTVLALTATANDSVAQDIDSTLPLSDHVVDNTSRDNLFVCDHRNIRNKDEYLANLVASGEKTVVYVNSREQSVAVARTLRKYVPQMASLIGFYNAGLERAERMRIENLFRTDALQVLVATSAFGEGVNIPNVRHVVLYHMPFSEIEFNQMSGRAGRDGKPAYIHLLFGRADEGINRNILNGITPDRDIMAQIYRQLRFMQGSGNEFFTVTNDDLAALSSTDRVPVSPAGAACGVAVFRELGLIETEIVSRNGRVVRNIRVVQNGPKCELTDSVRYVEGLEEQRIFSEFRNWVLSAHDDALNMRITHPIVPGMYYGF